MPDHTTPPDEAIAAARAAGLIPDDGAVDPERDERIRRRLAELQQLLGRPTADLTARRQLVVDVETDRPLYRDEVAVVAGLVGHYVTEALVELGYGCAVRVVDPRTGTAAGEEAPRV